MTHHYTARRGIGLSEILTCGDDRDQVIREALRYERHPTIVAQGPGVRCARCGALTEADGTVSF